MYHYMDLFDSCVYAFDGKNNIMEEKDLGITGDISSLLTPERSVTLMECFQGCPYTCTSFNVEIRIDGERVRASSWKWLPNAILRGGSSRNFDIQTITAVIPQMRTVVEKITVSSLADEAIQAPVALLYRGRACREDQWQFSIPAAQRCTREDFSADGRILTGQHGGAAFRITTSLERMQLFPRAYLWESEITIPAHGTVTMYFSAHLGNAEESLREAEYSLDRYEELLQRSFDYLLREAAHRNQSAPAAFRLSRA